MLRSALALTLRTLQAYSRHGIARSAAALAYFMVLTLFPLLMGANFLIGSLHLSLEHILADLTQLLPGAVLSALTDYLDYAARTQSPALMPACLFTLLVCASAALRTLFQAMDDLFSLPDRQGPGRLVLSFVLSALFLPTMYLSVAVVLTGDWFFHLLEGLLLFAFVLLLVAAIYRLGIPRERLSPRGLWGFSALTALAMVVCSSLFSWFMGMSTRYTLVYGSLASLIILLVWLYFCGNILLLGAAVCSVWTRSDL